MKENLKPDWLKGGLLLAGFWLFVGVLDASMVYVSHLLTGEALSEGFEPVWTVLAWSTWIPTSVIALWFMRRFPVTHRTWYYAVPIHVVGAAVCILFLSALYTAMRGAEALLTQTAGFAYFDYLLTSFAQLLALDSIIYLGGLVTVHAFMYYRRYRERTLQAERLKSDLAEAQLHALSLQLRPHFLFNSFHTIAMLVRRHEEERATETIASLSDFLRYILEGDGIQEVPLKQELDFMKSYVAVEKARYGDQLDVRVDAEAEALRALVPNLLLQPLVENAIRHGLRPVERPGGIDVEARREGSHLRLRVQDNGRGLPDGWRLEEQRGVGLSNTKARLRRLYGSDHYLNLHSPPGEEGLTVTIMLPYRTEDEREVAPRELVSVQ